VGLPTGQVAETNTIAGMADMQARHNSRKAVCQASAEHAADVQVQAGPGRALGLVLSAVTSAVCPCLCWPFTCCCLQVLVYHDLLGMMSHPHHAKVTPKFCKRYAEVGHLIQQALGQYKQDVADRSFPGSSSAPTASPQRR